MSINKHKPKLIAAVSCYANFLLLPFVSAHSAELLSRATPRRRDKKDGVQGKSRPGGIHTEFSSKDVTYAKDTQTKTDFVVGSSYELL
jgi:hypothetical protein